MKFTTDTFKKLPLDLFDNIKEIVELTTISHKDTMLILELKRDKHLNYRRPCEQIVLENPGLVSIYTKFAQKYHLVGGQPEVKDLFNNFIFSLSPYSPIKNRDQDRFYRTASSMCPKGTTRNAIVIETHSGILPTHISFLYNKIYGIDVNKTSYNEAKNNLALNKKNNCMMFNTEPESWLKDFLDHKYTTPGKKQKIGLAILNPELISSKGIGYLEQIKPETLVLFSNSEEVIRNSKEAFIRTGFDPLEEKTASAFIICKMKWRDLERP